jgi:hypothetical protein
MEPQKPLIEIVNEDETGIGVRGVYSDRDHCQ